MTIASPQRHSGGRLLLFAAVFSLLTCAALSSGAAGASSQLSATPPARYEHSLVVANGKALLFGGQGAQGLFADLWLYDGAWQNVTASGGPPARARHAAAVAGGRMFVFFGQGEAGVLLDDVWVFDPLSRAWQQRQPGGPPPAARAGHSAVAIGNDVFIFGGRVVGGITDDCVWRYRTASNVWERGACLAPGMWPGGALMGQAAFAVNGMLYVYPPDATMDSLLRYDPVGNAWQAVPVLDDFYAPRSWSAVAWREDRAWLFGGDIPTIGQTPNILEYTIPDNGAIAALRPLPCLPAARSNARAVALTGGSGAASTLTQVLIFGGQRGGQPVAEPVVYTVGPASSPTATPTPVPPTATFTPGATSTPTATGTVSTPPTATPTAGTPPAFAWHVYLPLLLISP